MPNIFNCWNNIENSKGSLFIQNTKSIPDLFQLFCDVMLEWFPDGKQQHNDQNISIYQLSS